MNHFLVLFLIIFPTLFSSCTYLINNINENKQVKLIKTIPDKNSCQNSKQKNIELIEKNPYNMENFIQFISLVKKWNKISLIEQSVLFSLLQMNIRPDLSSPTSELKLVINYNGKQEYFHFSGKNQNTFPYLFGLETILKHYNSKFSLLSLASILSKHYKKQIIIDQQFEQFLKNNNNNLKSHSIFKRYFFKAENFLKEKESLPPLPFKMIIKRYKKLVKNEKNQPSVSRKLFPYNIDVGSKSTVIRCNHNINLYKTSKYTISPNFSENNIFGIQDKTGNSFLATSSQSTKTIKPIFNTFLIGGNNLNETSAICIINNTKKNVQLSLFSFDDRDPRQHLFHLIQYEISESTSLSIIDEFIKFPRHLFLANPVRMLYESSRGSKKQLESFLATNFPIYHSEQLGNIWIHGKFNGNNNENGFVKDDRWPAFIKCN